MTKRPAQQSAAQCFRMHIQAPSFFPSTRPVRRSLPQPPRTDGPRHDAWSCRPWITSVVFSIRERLTESCWREMDGVGLNAARNTTGIPVEIRPGCRRSGSFPSQYAHPVRGTRRYVRCPARGGKACAEFHALDCRNGKYGACNQIFQPAEHRLANACRKPVYHTFDHAADGIPVCFLPARSPPAWPLPHRRKQPGTAFPRLVRQTARCPWRARWTKMRARMEMPSRSSSCIQTPPAMHSGAVSRPEKCPPPLTSCAPPNLTCAV